MEKWLLVEENLKENQIRFWTEKHIRYSELVAVEEFERRKGVRPQTIKANIWGTPDERISYLKAYGGRCRFSFVHFCIFSTDTLLVRFFGWKEGLVFHFCSRFGFDCWLT